VSGSGLKHTAACDKTWARREKDPRRWALARRSCPRCQAQALTEARKVLARIREHRAMAAHPRIWTSVKVAETEEL
jgi:hypothetical protein